MEREFGLSTAGDGDEAAERVVYVDVAHEALIREWPTLREWLDTDPQGCGFSDV